MRAYPSGAVAQAQSANHVDDQPTQLAEGPESGPRPVRPILDIGFAMRRARQDLDKDDLGFLRAVAFELGRGRGVRYDEFRTSLAELAALIRCSRSHAQKRRTGLAGMGVIQMTDPGNEAQEIPPTFRISQEHMWAIVPPKPKSRRGGPRSGKRVISDQRLNTRSPMPYGGTGSSADPYRTTAPLESDPGLPSEKDPETGVAGLSPDGGAANGSFAATEASVSDSAANDLQEPSSQDWDRVEAEAHDRHHAAALDVSPALHPITASPIHSATPPGTAQTPCHLTGSAKALHAPLKQPDPTPQVAARPSPREVDPTPSLRGPAVAAVVADLRLPEARVAMRPHVAFNARLTPQWEAIQKRRDVDRSLDQDRVTDRSIVCGERLFATANALLTAEANETDPSWVRVADAAAAVRLHVWTLGIVCAEGGLRVDRIDRVVADWIRKVVLGGPSKDVQWMARALEDFIRQPSGGGCPLP